MDTARLCVTVTADTTAELRRRRDEVVDADLVELRVDTVRDPDAAAALADRTCAVIFTCRPQWEGGYFHGSEEERFALLQQACDLGADYVDIEWKSGFADRLIASGGGQRIVVSAHHFDGVPGDLASCYAAMRGTGAAVVKVAVTATRLTDCLPLLALNAADDRPLVLLAMGEAGLATRVLASRFGSAWTYGGEAVAPGQIPARQLRQLGFGRVHAGTQIFGVVGRPVMHSLSPAMHNAGFESIGFDGVYLPLAAATFDDFLELARALDIRGASVTAPFKRAAFEAATAMDEDGRRAGSVNTLRRTESGWAACNTDGAGFLEPLTAKHEVSGLRATVLGAGGAARSVADALRRSGALASIAARNRDRATEVARAVEVAVAEWPPAPGTWDLLVNATPVGTWPDVQATPLPTGPFTGSLVYDLVYNPAETRLLADARAAGCETLGGLDMLVAQAARQFEWWTGRRAPTGVMRDAAMAAVRSGRQAAAERV
jgi:3-dehydroquinate dehydratase/shikimate dehydrogenase